MWTADYLIGLNVLSNKFHIDDNSKGIVVIEVLATYLLSLHSMAVTLPTARASTTTTLEIKEKSL